MLVLPEKKNFEIGGLWGINLICRLYVEIKQRTTVILNLYQENLIRVNYTDINLTLIDKGIKV